MGEIAAREADRIILTDEESYNEDPTEIRAQIYEGIGRVKGGEMKTTEIADRKEAIKKALSVAKKGDTVLITGMGHEQYRIINGKREPWNDGDVVRELLSDIKAESSTSTDRVSENNDDA
jgi:UDP-N-acetylmuramoyl-L-alanyl-D-glutamate--2,6-diaminopimelate ligase